MYRIRTVNKDGTLGGFYSDSGIVKDVSLAKTYTSNLTIQADLERAYNMSGRYFQPVVNYGVETQAEADLEKSRTDRSINIMLSLEGKILSGLLGMPTPALPPFEDKPSANNLGAMSTPEIIINDIDGGFLNQFQIEDLDGGGA